MAHRNYLIRYANGFKQHVSRAELIALTDLQQIGPREYLSKQTLQHSLEQANGPHYLSGAFVFELAGKRDYERMQTPKGQLKQLEAMGWQPSGALA